MGEEGRGGGEEGRGRREERGEEEGKRGERKREKVSKEVVIWSFFFHPHPVWF